MIDIVSLPGDGRIDIAMADSQAPRAANILSVQQNSLRYAQALGIDLEYFLDPRFSFQDSAFKAYLVQRLAAFSIDVSSVIEQLEALYMKYTFNLPASDSNGSLISR